VVHPFGIGEVYHMLQVAYFVMLLPTVAFPESYWKAGYIPSRRDMFRVMVFFPVGWRRSRVSLLCTCIMNNDLHKSFVSYYPNSWNLCGRTDQSHVEEWTC
jgi:hypothetical protein